MGGTGVGVGATGVSVGETGVSVGGMGVFVGRGVGVKPARAGTAGQDTADIVTIKADTMIAIVRFGMDPSPVTSARSDAKSRAAWPDVFRIPQQTEDRFAN